VRTHVDWLGRLAAQPGSVAFVVVLPESGTTDGPTIKARMNRALAGFTGEAATHERLIIGFGFASLDRSSGEGKKIEVDDLVGVAEQCRQCPGHSGTEQLSTIQRSVGTHVAISCRHGYVVESSCTLKAEGLLGGESPARSAR
jgi:hypothetical protein